MLVDNPLQQPYFSTSSSYPDYNQDLSEIFHTELFASTSTLAAPSGSNSATSSNSPAAGSSSSESRASSPQSPFQGLLTPPQSNLPTSFPEVRDGSSSSYFNFLEEDLKGSDMSSTAYDLFTTLDMSMGHSSVDMSLMNLGLAIPSGEQSVMGIDPQLVGTPAPSHSVDDFDEEEEPSPAPDTHSEAPSPAAEKEKLTFTITPAKVGGHGKARKGTVHSGGIVKKPTVPATMSPTLAAARRVTGILKPRIESEEAEDELPVDWRPSPEVYAKMSSKEKRQLRNKISARNFRVRRKEYISTLEGDIAERDRLLDAIRTELGESRNENQALRQEIAALKKVLLDGRGAGDPPVLNLPPPAPLPAQSAAATLAASNNANTTNTATSNLLTANPHKDLPNSPRLNPRAFWGGVGMGIGMGGITPVHTALMPDVVLGNVRSNKVHLQENINPALNLSDAFKIANKQQQQQNPIPGFDGFADLNPLTMKTLDAYRMHLWAKMGAQHQAHQQQQQRENALAAQASQLSGLAVHMRPQFLVSHTPNKLGLLSPSISPKHPASYYPSPPSSPRLGASSTSKANAERLQQEQQTAAFTALASQTLFQKLGSAFWDAFSGSSPSPSSSYRPLDTDKVRRVLEGKAVVRIVDLEPSTSTSTAPMSTGSSLKTPLAKEKCSCTDILEESMRSLTLGKKNL